MTNAPAERRLSDLDPELDTVLDAYFDGLKERAKQRCVRAFDQYHGSSWHGRTIERLIEMLNEELVDAFVYDAMVWWRSKGEHSRCLTGPVDSP